MATVMDYNSDEFIRVLSEIGAEIGINADQMLTQFWYAPNNGRIHKEIDELFNEFFGPFYGLDEVTIVFEDIHAKYE